MRSPSMANDWPVAWWLCIEVETEIKVETEVETEVEIKVKVEACR